MRHTSEDLPDRTNAPCGQSAKTTLEDMEWAPRLLDAKIFTGAESQSRLAGRHTVGAKSGKALMVGSPDDYSLCAHTASLKMKGPGPHVSATSRGRPEDSHADSMMMPPPPNPRPRRALAVAVEAKSSVVPCPPPAAPPLRADCSRSQGQPRLLGSPSSQPTSRLLPALGMRRVNTYSGSSSPTVLQPSQNLPTKQRGFKVPAIRPSAGSQAPAHSASPSQTSNTMKIEPRTGSAMQHPNPTPSPRKTRPQSAARERSRSPSPPLEADSSYGDISLDMDAVEETMKQYDNA